jgi:shikimate kinase
MGCGKSTFGCQLASELDWQYADLDELIEERYKISISGFFEKYGEDNFRRIENMMLREVLSWKNGIISTGGGTPCFYNNMELMNKFGTTVFLDTSIPILVERLIRGQRKRPLLKGIEVEALNLKINNHLSQRRFYYEQAQFKLTEEEQDVNHIKEKLGL